MRRSVFWLQYFVKNIFLAFKLLLRGDAGRVFRSLYARAFREVYSLWFCMRAPGIRANSPGLPSGEIAVQTDNPVAYKSPDHVAPFGTMYDNSTNRKFVLRLNQIAAARFPTGQRCFMDLGCSGGQLVADFRTLGWTAVGLEGSDFSLKHKRANWATLANKNLFTCDITKPFQVVLDERPLRFHLITAWEVLEHIHGNDLPMLFENISKHLVDGGFFIASTASGSSIVNGVELHQTRWTNPEWRRFMAERVPSMVPADLGLKIHHYVRYDYGEPSFLVYQKRDATVQFSERLAEQRVTEIRK